MTTAPDRTILLDPGNYQRGSTCLALVGPPNISIQWACSVMEVQFPPNHERSILCYSHPDLDTSRNIAIRQWLLSGAMQSEWLALLAAESPIRWDAVCGAILSGSKATRIGESYILHRDSFGEPPWFQDGAWRGAQTRERPDLGVASQAPPEETDQRSADQLIVTCVPSFGRTSMVWAAHALTLANPMASCHALVCAIGYEVGDARCRLAQAVLDMRPRPKYLFFYGDDNIPPVNGLRLLMETMEQTGAKAVAGMYYQKDAPPSVPLLWRNGHAGPLIPGVHFTLGDVIEVDGTGLDFVLIDVEALAQVQRRPLFETVTKWIEGRGMLLQTEDAAFWDGWREVHGKGPLVDTRCRVGHYNERRGAIY